MELLDFTPGGLFPDHLKYDEDPKCNIVAAVMKEMCSKLDMTGVTQERIRTDSQKRYDFISNEARYSLPQADDLAFTLHRKGVTVETAKKYASFLLMPEDVAKWEIKIVQ